MAYWNLPEGDVLEIRIDYIEYDEGGMRITVPGERSCYLNGEPITETQARALLDNTG